MSNFVTTVDKLLRIPYQIDRERDVCIRCNGIGVIYSRKGFNGRNPSRPVQCPDCGGKGRRVTK